MFGIGLPELVVIAVVAVVVFGPDRLPEYARQAGRFVRQLRNLAQNAQDQLRDELGPEYADLKLTDLDPRQAIRKHILEAMDEDDFDEPAAAAGVRGARPRRAAAVRPRGDLTAWRRIEWTARDTEPHGGPLRRCGIIPTLEIGAEGPRGFDEARPRAFKLLRRAHCSGGSPSTSPG